MRDALGEEKIVHWQLEKGQLKQLEGVEHLVTLSCHGGVLLFVSR